MIALLYKQPFFVINYVQLVTCCKFTTQGAIYRVGSEFKAIKPFVAKRLNSPEFRKDTDLVWY